MTPASHEALDLALRRRVLGPLREARLAIEEALADAAAHAWGLAASDPGAWRYAAGESPPLRAARRCLSRLGRDLVRIVKQSRVACYHDSHSMHQPHLNPDVHLIGTVPSHECAIACREAAIHGQSLATQAEATITMAFLSLQKAVTASLASESGPARQGALGAWQAQETESLTARTLTWLLDSSRAIHDCVGYGLIKPELRPEL